MDDRGAASQCELDHLAGSAAAARGAPLPASLQKRADAIRSMLILHRESLARLAANTDRQAAGLLPPNAAATYGDGLGARGAAPGVARIYRSAG